MTSQEAHIVDVRLDNNRSYKIHIGAQLLKEAGTHLSHIAPRTSCLIVTDENVASHHLSTLRESLAQAQIRHATLILPPGEASKSYAQFEKVCEVALESKIERGDAIIALGGGVMGDLVGFAAASVRRGVTFIQMPTSLLAQVDSSVGGKTGINSPHGKNLIGAFYQPILVLADTHTLTTLPKREFKAGYAEILKYGLLGDAALFEWLEQHQADIFAHGPSLAKAIQHSCLAKAGIVERDEKEMGERMLLNLGHTFGHALEVLTHYNSTQLIHGEGVAIGMACAFRFSHALGLCSHEDVARVETHLITAGLPTKLKDIPGFSPNSDAILEAMYQDKKVQHGTLTFVLVRGIGQAFVQKNVDSQAVRMFLQTECSR